MVEKKYNIFGFKKLWEKLLPTSSYFECIEGDLFRVLKSGNNYKPFFMRKKYKNELFYEIKELGLTPDDFSLLELPEDSYNTIIKYKDTPFYFSLTNSQDSYEEFECYYIQYAPEFPESQIYPDRGFVLFNFILDKFKSWVKYHIKEYELDEFEPDLWSEYKNGNTTLNFNEIDFNDKNLFTTHEKKQISMAINELKLLINKNFESTVEEQKLVNERLEYLIESTRKLNKFDWKSLVLSTVIGIATTLTLDVEKGKLLFELFRQVFSTVRSINK